MRKLIAVMTAGALVLSLAACDRSSDGDPIDVKSADKLAEIVLTKALSRYRRGQLNKPVTVNLIQPGTSPNALFELSWSPARLSAIGGEEVDNDILLDRADIKILSREGLPVFYNYCFVDDGDHAQVATTFCTKTLIAAMKKTDFKPTN
ncbi:hypothetical protein [Asticcacaulis sp. AC402]|uniref:hypothetical protein n=1 Tax=Asticcacaulis sp. AC402 TaxID=1282361 RepID=UPI0003C3B101|nr:hypothetical protein [Asticcacaulis sp. AC402]ESQ74282.1 hypothetical protein ABAC402_15050 [Asticcacaulis sp. AC402]